MRQPKIAIVDTILPYRTNIRPWGGVGEATPLLSAGSGHGYHGYSIINRWTPTAEFYSLPVLDQFGRGRSEYLIDILEHLLTT